MIDKVKPKGLGFVAAKGEVVEVLKGVVANLVRRSDVNPSVRQGLPGGEAFMVEIYNLKYNLFMLNK